MFSARRGHWTRGFPCLPSESRRWLRTLARATNQLPKGAKLKWPDPTAAEIAPATPFTHLVRSDLGTQLTLVLIDLAPSQVTTSSPTSMTNLTLENYAREN